MAQQEFTWTDELVARFFIFQRRNQHLDLPIAVAEFKKGQQHKLLLFTTDDGFNVYGGDYFYSVDIVAGVQHRLAIPPAMQRKNTFHCQRAAFDFYYKLKDAPPTFEQITRPVIEWLAKNKNPHTYALVTNDRADLLQSTEGFSTDEFIKD